MMSEEPNPQTTEASYAPMTQLAASSMVVIEETLDHFFQTADVQAVYGKPIQNGETLIIPAAEVLCAMGFGIGAGNGPEMGENQSTPGGSGGGGGGRTFSRPAAVIIVGPQGVEIRPVMDITKIALAGITAIGFMVSMIARMRRR
jgi:uncharacterized spore protein YtfJ